MARPQGQSGTADPIAAEYFTWESAGPRFLVHMHRDAIEGLSRDVIEGSEGLPVEVGGLLLGHAGRGERPVVWIERYQRVQCRHSSGPHFILDREDHKALEQSAADLSEVTGDLSIVGIYRSHLRPGFELEAPDFELADRYFKDPEDLFLLIGPSDAPAGPAELRAQFYLHDRTDGNAPGQIRAADPAVPFNGPLVNGPLPTMLEPDSEDAPAAEDPAEITGRSAPVTEPPMEPKPVREHVRRLVPDFGPAASESPRPPRELFMDSRPNPSLLGTGEDLDSSQSFLRRRWPMIAALLLVGAVAAVFVQQATHRDALSAAPVSETRQNRPLGLYVDPSGQSWLVSWNPSATQGARGVKLFVREGEDQNLIPLTPQDLQTGTYPYQAKGQDVTFRLEVTDATGRVSEGSFRLMRTAEAKPSTPAPQTPVAVAPRPKPTNRVAPVVPASIRPRIKGTVPMDIRVKIDERGRVVSATPVNKPHSGLESFLSERAVEAARQWRFEPAEPATEIIHFTFKR